MQHTVERDEQLKVDQTTPCVPLILATSARRSMMQLFVTSSAEHRVRIYGYTGPRNMGPVTVPSGLRGTIRWDGLRDGYPRIRPSNDDHIWPYDRHEGSLVSLIIHSQCSINTSPLRPAPSLCCHPYRQCGSESVAGSIIFEFVTLSMRSLSTRRSQGGPRPCRCCCVCRRRGTCGQTW